jgi:SM-20-related protein
MNELQENLNQLLYLGLKSHEAHFSIYEKGDFYKKHYDAFKHTNLSEKNRILTTVFYLNKNYHDNNRGEIVIYDSDDNILETITPNLGKMLIFLSEKFPHEVLPTETTRLSIAGWFR